VPPHGERLAEQRSNVRLHLTVGMREFIAANAHWLTASQLPA
jgi:hypothetical protein